MRLKTINHKKGIKPNIHLSVRRVEASAFATLGFAKEHYLTAKINPSCKCLLFEWNDIPIAFVGILNTPRKSVPYGMSISRIVILPSYQGLGLSMKIMDFVSGIIKSLSTEEKEYRVYIKTAHALMGQGLSNNPKWKGTQFDGKTRSKESTESEGKKYKARLMRKSYCKEYVGEAIYGFKDVLKPINEMRKEKKKPCEMELKFEN